MRELPKPQELYRHFKGNTYQIIGIAKDSENGKDMVVYQALYGDYAWYVRELSMFMSEVDHVKYPDVEQTYRFEKIVAGVGVQKEQVASKEESVTMKEEQVALKEESVTMKEEQVASKEEPVTVKEVPVSVKRDTQDNEPEMIVVQSFSNQQEEESPIDPMVMEFLDANTHEERLNILAGLHHRITNEMITTMAIASDVEVGGNDVEERYEELKQCLIMKDRFEIKRY